MRTILETPPIPRIVPDGVFDAFGWCPSRSLEWRAPDGCALGRSRVTADNPPHMVFVMKRTLSFLPREVARLHAAWLGRSLGPEDEWALAPYGIDDATDGLYAHGISPEDALWLATDSLPGLFWGLHDWAHFHSHGSFTDRASTELQCDAAALAWLWANRTVLELDEDHWEEVREDVARVSAGRFADEGHAFEPFVTGALDAERVKGWV